MALNVGVTCSMIDGCMRYCTVRCQNSSTYCMVLAVILYVLPYPTDAIAAQSHVHRLRSTHCPCDAYWPCRALPIFFWRDDAPCNEDRLIDVEWVPRCHALAVVVIDRV